MLTEIVDSLYEAAFISEKWPAVLEGVTRAAASKGGALFVFADGLPVRGKAIPSLQGLMKEVTADETLRLSTAATRMSELRPASFIDVDSFMTPQEIRDDPVRIRLRTLGLGANTCAAIPMPSGELVMFVFQRGLEDGAYAPEHLGLLDRLRPDMARASLAATRLGLERARGTVNALATIGLPAAVLAGNGRVRATNTLFDQEKTLFVATAFGGIALANPESNRLFQMAVQARDGEPVSRSIPLRSALPPPVVVHVLPLKRDAHDLFGGCDLLIVATAISASALVPSPTILTGLFDLTAAEVRLATALAKGLNLQVAAAEAGLQFSTVRTYLNRIFRKTGTNQQSQLVALLKSAHPFQQ
ncbi:MULTISPECIES: helix-turn-helix transcriptional regulator [unclassified Mesorhizobium]|uniref:helix-turn-helix transcriptional regulator n=1 Tax=unclassified Mesorhizobium TaxID=325217 RepID=UPI000FCA9D46|nr:MULTISPECIES: helix-turn-helix transcriptional regulator [unclassified Mesorhizobium]RUZ46615.1 helix-turn-helix transcriptional regulator [Mesorhizobium sp. M7A.F.Ca.US.003.02.1.1]RUZ60188.1 helix-turn-helix transcriptional regulator [Mesorhizobium sp. M7A.F.Ca.US.007.01.1.1]